MKVAVGTKPQRRSLTAVLNLPNQLTTLRLLLSVVLFCLISWGYFLASLILFVIAAATDWLDGYYARKYNQVTTLGRILDPFADKVIICGTFILMAAVPAMYHSWFGLRPWMVVVVVGRELLVTALRSFIEQRGADFSAKLAGKLKMVLQCVAACVGLWYLTYPLVVVDGIATVEAPAWCCWLLGISVWLAVISTIYSGVGYVVAAVRLLQK